MDKTFLEHIVREDLGDGDHTSLSTIPGEATGSAKLLVKEQGVVAGVSVAKEVADYIDQSLQFEVFIQDGSLVSVGDIVFEISGSTRSILQAERLMLNLMQRMSGIATKTHHICELIAGTGTKLLDTRKTTPGLRQLEKQAVLLGGGVNHRMGLYDMIMIKDNHVDFAGGIKEAIDAAKLYLAQENRQIPIEVEARDLDEVQQILNIGGVDRIMLDNFTIEDTRTAVAQIAGTVETESSGGITEETIRSYAECGVTYISVGALTHSVKSLDLSLKAS